MSCRICGSENLTKYLDLGSMPLANKLLNTKDDQTDKYPLEVYFCQDCYLSQLGVVVDPQKLYKDYPYRSHISRTYTKHCYDLGFKIWELYGGSGYFHIPSPRVLDIGSNDGTLLHQLKRHGISARLAVDPDPTLNIYLDKDIHVLNTFFSWKTMAPLKRLLNIDKLDFITATNVFAHCDNLAGFLDGVRLMLSDYGVFILEVPHAYNMIVNNEFDTIYHEHLSYFLLKPLIKLFKSCGLNIFDVDEFPIHGGTIRIYASRDSRVVNKSVERIIQKEKDGGLYSIEIYIKFSQRIDRMMLRLLDVLNATSGKQVLGYGASAKGSTLLNYKGLIKSSHIEYIIDDTETKQGKIIPGCNIPIRPYNFQDIMDTDYIVLLAWNFKEEIMVKVNNCGYRGKWIVPVPNVEIL